MDNPETLATLGIQDKQNINTTQKTKKMSNTDPIKKTRGELVRSPCYPPIQSSPVKVLAVIEERKILRKK